MSFDTPHHRPALMRENTYARLCAHCGAGLAPSVGVAYLQWDAAKGKNTWRSACGISHLSINEQPESCFAKIWDGIPPAPATPTGPVAAKVVNDAKADAALLTALETAPAFQMPEAEAFAPIMQAMINAMSKDIVDDVAAEFLANVPSMVADLLATARPVAITINDRPTVAIERTHAAFADVLDMVIADTQPMLVGPAGSGKTTLAKQVATALDLPFLMASRISSEHKLMGYYHPHNGELIKTPFRMAWEFGGVFLLDEVDASDADAITAINAALAGDIADFPDGLIKRHPDFKCIAAGNTFGRGADRVYVGRNQLDGATLDRFQVYEVDYDEQLELTLAGNDTWTRYVQRVRAATMAEKVLHVVSPRASIAGARLLARGWEQAKVEESCVWKGLDKAQRNRIVNRMNGGF